MAGATKEIGTIIGVLTKGITKSSSLGREMAKGVHLARPRLNQAILTLEPKGKNGAKTIETVKKFDRRTFHYSRVVGEKWQEITEADGMVTTKWSDPLLKAHSSVDCQSMRYGWRKEYPDGTIELFTDGGITAVGRYDKEIYGYKNELSYMFRQGDKSLIAIKNGDGLTIRAKDFQLDNGVTLNGHYQTFYPHMMGTPNSVVGDRCSIAPEGTDKGVLYELFSTVNDFLKGLRKPAV